MRTLELDLNSLTDAELESYLLLKRAVMRKKIEDDNKTWLSRAISDTDSPERA